MDDAAILRAVQSCHAALFVKVLREIPVTQSVPIDPVRCDPNANLGGPVHAITRVRHALALLAEVPIYVAEGRTSHAAHVLGFVQGYLWTIGALTMNDVIDMVSAPTPEPKEII